jgi:putative peptide zinc metalloprotease protein
VAGAGMITEVFVAALAAFVWARTGPGTVHSLAYNIMFIASVSTVLFNGNPLLRFDGYYILSDLLEIPNLHTRSTRHLRHLVEYYAFGYKDSYSPARTRREAGWLTVFGIASGIYRVVVFTGIVLFIADKFLLAGLLMALVCVVSWVLVPLYKLFVYLISSPRLVRTRARAVLISTGFFISLVGFLAVLPFPDRFRAPGVLESVQYVRVINGAPGYVTRLVVESGKDIGAGDPILVLTNREIDMEINATLAQREETMAMQLKAMHLETADLEPISKRLAAVNSKLEELQAQKEALLIRARQGGTWVSPHAQEMVGAWVNRGEMIGEIVDRSAFRFSAVVSQREAAELFNGEILRSEVRLYGQGGKNLTAEGFQIIPYQQEMLPSAALGWYGGGEVAVNTQDDSGRKATEPFFQIYADLPREAGAVMHHGQSGKLRITLPAKPLLLQWGKKLRQLLQERYQI